MSYLTLSFNLGYICQHIGTVLQLIRIESKKSVDAVCLDTQILFLFGAISRIFWVKETILNDVILTKLELFTSLLTLSYTLYVCLFKYNNLSVFQSLNKSGVPFYIRWYVILPLSTIFSLIFFPGNEEGSYEYDSQTLVSFNIFVESMGLLPQIVAVRREKDSNTFSRSYILFLSVSRIVRMLFWLEMYMNDSSFAYLLIADCINLVMVLGFVYTFFSNLDRLILPTDSKTKEN
jgi:hypothetical protein